MNILMIFMAMLLVAMSVEPVARRLHVPFTALLVLVGFAGSELIVAAGGDTGLRWRDFNYLILHVFVPILVFESAFNMQAGVLLRNLPVVLVLAIPAMLLAAGVTGLVVYFGIGYPQAFPLVAALLCGVIVSATDPVAVVALFRELGAPPRLAALLEGESLFNDATAVVLYSLLVAMAVNSEDAAGGGAATVTFLYMFGGGVLAGLAIGSLAALLSRLFSGAVSLASISLITACSAFYLAEHFLRVSGIVAVLCAGLLLGERYRREAGASEQHFSAQLWELGAYIANALLFLLLGVTVTVGMFSSHWLAMLLGIAGATVARAGVIYLLLPPVVRALPVKPLPASYRPVIMWGGLRGAVAAALALSLPTDIESWYTIQSIAYGVVLFTLFVQAPLMPRLVRRTLTAGRGRSGVTGG